MKNGDFGRNIQSEHVRPIKTINKLSFGDEKARRILAQIASMADMVDRDSVNGAMGPLMSLDSLGIDDIRPAPTLVQWPHIFGATAGLVAALVHRRLEKSVA